MPDVRKGQAPAPLDRDAFRDRFAQSFVDPAFAVEKDAIARLELIAWHAYEKGRKAALTHAAGPGFVDPDYKLSDEWRATRDRIVAAEARQRDRAAPSRVLVVIGSARNDGTCPGEISKTFRLATWAGEIFAHASIETDMPMTFRRGRCASSCRSRREVPSTARCASLPRA